jgi:hypothetical protein
VVAATSSWRREKSDLEGAGNLLFCHCGSTGLFSPHRDIN